MTNDNQLLIKDLNHNYFDSNKKVFSLTSINLSLKKGELMGLIGPSGCGKTTLLRCVAGFENPNSGKIFIDDKLVSSEQINIPPEKRSVGMVFQDYALFPHLNSWQNICFGVSKAKKDRALWLLELLGLSDLRFRYPHELSGGQKQRLALGRALAPGNSFVLLDEPFSSLDVDVRYRLRSELKTVLETCSASAILVTHDPEEALAICDRVAVMNKGEIHQYSSPQELVECPKTIFVGRFALHRNVLPVKYSDGKLISSIGSIKCDIPLANNINYQLLINENAIFIDKSHSGRYIVEGREFLGNSWRIKINLDQSLFRVYHDLENPPRPGQKCNIKFKEGKSGILFPGSSKIQF